MQITIFGASGKVGSLVVEEALRRGFSVIAFVHSHDMFVPSNKLRVVKGDIYNEADVQDAIKGSAAVVSCLGSWGTKHRNVLASAMRAIIPAMEHQKIGRIVTLTGSGAAAPSAKPGVAHSALLKLLTPFPAGKVFRDGEEHMKLLAASNLGWTTLRSPIMTSGNKTKYRLTLKSGSLTIPRAAVATALLDQLDNKDYLHQTPIISGV